MCNSNLAVGWSVERGEKNQIKKQPETDKELLKQKWDIAYE